MIGKVIKQKIKAKGITLRAVADAMGESPQNLQQLLRSNMHVNTETLERVAKAINEPISYFYDEYEVRLLRQLVKLIESKNK